MCIKYLKHARARAQEAGAADEDEEAYMCTNIACILLILLIYYIIHIYYQYTILLLYNIIQRTQEAGAADEDDEAYMCIILIYYIIYHTYILYNII